MKDINPRLVPEHELAGIRSRAIKRAARRLEEREHLRLEIKSRKLMEEMHVATFKLFAGVEESPTEPGLIVPLTRDRIAALKAGADIAAKMLNKVLPDLKQVELKEEDSQNAERTLNSISLDNHLRLYLDAVAQRNAERDTAVEAEIVSDPEEFLK